MKTYTLTASETKKLGDKTEQHFDAKYSEADTLALEKELSTFSEEQLEDSGVPANPSAGSGIDARKVIEKLNIVAAESRKDLLGLFERIEQGVDS